MFKEGDLVKIKDDYAKQRINSKWVAEHGYLWLVMRLYRDKIYCKPLATGDDNKGEGWLWYDHELEKANV